MGIPRVKRLTTAALLTAALAPHYGSSVNRVCPLLMMVTPSRCFSFPIDESSLFETEGFGAFPSVLPLHHRAWLISAQLISGVRSPQPRSPVLLLRC
ncbi:hypothetical protein RIF29_19606 [Crotalaria pallida]|uniref:Uncharacterized protein n=1 Tax=Crotalaria pallida TaxID=3830 RepID=A0AAN9F1K6_CROPI